MSRNKFNKKILMNQCLLMIILNLFFKNKMKKHNLKKYLYNKLLKMKYKKIVLIIKINKFNYNKK